MKKIVKRKNKIIPPSVFHDTINDGSNNKLKIMYYAIYFNYDKAQAIQKD